MTVVDRARTADTAVPTLSPDDARSQLLLPDWSRRRFLRLTGAGVGVAALSPIIAACAGASQQSPGQSAGQSQGGGASAAPSVAGASLGPPASEVTLEFWNPFTGPDGEFMQKLVEQFNDEHETLAVNVTRQAEYYTKLRAAATSNQLPQVAIVHLDQIAQHAADGIITPVDDLAKALDLSADDFTEPVWNGGVWQDNRYAIPLDIHTTTFFWNKEHFEKAGLDPEQVPEGEEAFMAAAKAITTEAGVPGYMTSVNNFLVGIVWSSLFYQAGGEWTNADYTEATFNSEAGVKAAQLLKDLVEQGITPKGTASDGEIAAFKAGDAGMVMLGIWETTGMRETLGDKVGIGPVPQVFGKGVWAGSHNLTVTKGVEGDARQAAYYFINWISEHSAEWAAAGQLPARKSARETPEFDGLTDIVAISQQVDDARFFPPVVGFAPIVFDPGGAGEAVLLAMDGQDPQKTLDAAAQKASQILKENKDRYG
jgi:multiple sugar transport system substrate-binding protein